MTVAKYNLCGLYMQWLGERLARERKEQRENTGVRERERESRVEYRERVMESYCRG